MNTIDDLGHPLILETVKNLAWKQVGLGFCKPQDQEDLAQDLLLYLCRQFSRYTGRLPLVTWACRLLRGRINAINRRLLGVPSPSEQRRTGQASVAASLPKQFPTAAPPPEPSEKTTLSQATSSQQPELTPPVAAQPQTLERVSAQEPCQKPAHLRKANPEPKPPHQKPPVVETPNTRQPNPKPENPPNKTDRLLVLGAAVGSWWQRLLLFRAAILSRWHHPP